MEVRQQTISAIGVAQIISSGQRVSPLAKAIKQNMSINGISKIPFLKSAN